MDCLLFIELSLVAVDLEHHVLDPGVVEAPVGAGAEGCVEEGKVLLVEGEAVLPPLSAHPKKGVVAVVSEVGGLLAEGYVSLLYPLPAGPECYTPVGGEVGPQGFADVYMEPPPRPPPC